MKNKKSKIISIILGILAVYWAGLYIFQDYFIFFPDYHYKTPAQANMPEFAEKNYPAADGTMLRGWYFKGHSDKPAILFFHGNAGQIATFAPKMAGYIEAGYSVFMPEYRGFAKAPGKLTQKTMYEDGLAAYDFLQERLGHSRIIVFGYSMGTAAASATAARRSATGLVLAAPFYSLKEIVKEKPVPGASWLLRNELPSYQFVEKFEAPLLIIHGEKDRLIPCTHGKKLFDLATSPQKKYKQVAGENHNGLFFKADNHKPILEWLEHIND